MVKPSAIEKSIPFNRPFIVGSELDYIREAVMANGHLAANGPFTKKCQAWLEQHLGCPLALLTHSATAALEMAALLCDIGPGDEVIMPSFTFVSTANAFVLRGAVPVFVDIRSDTLNLDEDCLAAALTPLTRAVVPVHYAGVSCNLNAISAWAQEHDLLVIEDAAQALLSNNDTAGALGTIGDLGVLSFHETKNIISGEGGALLVNRESFAERAWRLWEKGTDRRCFDRGEVDKYTWVDLGSSFAPNELTAAFLYAQLEAAQPISSRRLQLWHYYAGKLAPLAASGVLRLPPPEAAANGHIFYLLTTSGDERDALLDYLRSRGVKAVFHYIPLHSSPAGQRYGRFVGELVHTDDLAARLVRLPLYYELTCEDIDYIVAIIFAFYRFS